MTSTQVPEVNTGEVVTNEEIPKRNPWSKVCTLEYAPVCGLVQVKCIKGPCHPVEQTFDNRCEMDVSPLTEFLHDGECES